MRLVLDTNEYLFAFGLLKEPFCEEVIAAILDQFPRHTLRIPAKILEEVRRNLTGEAFREFIAFLNTLSITIDQDFSVPFELGAKTFPFISSQQENVLSSLRSGDNRIIFEYQLQSENFLYGYSLLLLRVSCRSGNKDRSE